MTARRRRDNCGSGLPGAWFCVSETRHYSAARSLRSSKLKTVCLWRLRHKQNARFQLVWDDFRRGPGRAGESKLPSSATLADPGSGIAAAQQAGGGQGSGWSPIFLPASGSGCGLLFQTQKAPQTGRAFGKRPQCPDVRQLAAGFAKRPAG